MTEATLRADPSLTSYQRLFFDRFCAEMRPGSTHILLAPPGSGKSYTLAATIAELVRVDRVARVLVLCARALTEQWAYLMRGCGQDSRVLDVQALRMLQHEQAAVVASSWPLGVYAMSFDLASRSEVREDLTRVGWDLIAVDDAGRLAGDRLAFLESLASTDPQPALILATNYPQHAGGLAARATLIDWHQAIAEQLRGDVFGATKLIRQLCPYRRSDVEVRIAEEALETARQLGSSRGMTLLRSAASSVSSLENILVRMARAPGGPTSLHDSVEHLLEQVENLRVDSRLERFKRLVAELVDHNVKHVVVFCEYRATLEYLSAAAEGSAYLVHALHGALGGPRRRAVVDGFREEGGLLVTTGRATEAVSLGFAEAAIHYDLPVSHRAFAQRESRYHRFGRRTPCTVYFLEDESGALPLEAVLLRIVTSTDQVGVTPESKWSSIFQEVMSLVEAR